MPDFEYDSAISCINTGESSLRALSPGFLVLYTLLWGAFWTMEIKALTKDQTRIRIIHSPYVLWQSHTLSTVLSPIWVTGRHLKVLTPLFNFNNRWRGEKCENIVPPLFLLKTSQGVLHSILEVCMSEIQLRDLDCFCRHPRSQEKVALSLCTVCVACFFEVQEEFLRSQPHWMLVQVISKSVPAFVYFLFFWSLSIPGWLWSWKLLRKWSNLRRLELFLVEGLSLVGVGFHTAKR